MKLAHSNEIYGYRIMGKVRKILVVDDDSSILHLLRMMLTRKGYRVFTALSAKEARSVLAEDPDQHCIVLDLMMPTEDGFAFLEWLRKNPDFSDVPVIVNSARNLDDAEKKELESSAMGIVSKGKDFMEGILSYVENA